MKALGFSKFSVLGWCGGGVSAICLAAKFPDAVIKLVVWGSRTYLTEEDVKRSERIEDLERWDPHFREAYIAVYGISDLSKIWHGFINSLRAFRALKADGDVCTDEMTKIKCPALVVHGEKDRFCPLHTHSEYITTHIDGSRLHVIPDGGHDVHKHPTNEFNSVVEEFLKSQSHVTLKD